MKTRTLIVALVLGLLAVGAAALRLSGRLYRIPQNGMYPNLPAGSRFLARPQPYASPSEVQRGDVVIFQQTENGTRFNHIWRVVAVPGDSVVVEGPRLAINGSELSRVRVREDEGHIIFRETNPPASYEVAYPASAGTAEPPKASLTVPPGEFFVLGDNRYHAVDSRYIGTIPFAAIIGKKLWSP